jgi:hypothetical protein
MHWRTINGMLGEKKVVLSMSAGTAAGSTLALAPAGFHLSVDISTLSSQKYPGYLQTVGND